MSRWLLLTGIHLWKQAVSRSCTHLRKPVISHSHTHLRRYNITLQTNALIISDEIKFELQPYTHTHSYVQVTSERNLCWDDCYWKVLTSKIGQYTTNILTSKYAITLQSSTGCIYTITFSAGLNAFQVDQVDREISNQTSRHTQLVPSKLILACNERI